MPLVNVHMGKGRSVDDKRRMMDAITEAIVTSVGAPKDSVRVWITEMDDTDFMAGGELLADKRVRLAAEAHAGPEDQA